MRRITTLVLAALLAMTLPAAAQVTAEGSIRGTVKDEQGCVLPGVAISAKSPQAPTLVTTITDAEGSYRLQNVLPGEYVLTAELEGFSRIQQTGIVINAGLNITI